MAAEPSTDPLKLFEPREYVAGDGETLKYRLLKPADFNPDNKYPLVVFLHGAGERGDDNSAQLVHGMAEFCTSEHRQQCPCYVLAPQCPKEQKWTEVDWTADEPDYPETISRCLELTMQVVDEMLANSAVNKNRIYLVGLSMGGFGTWDALARRPELFAAAIPICGGGRVETASALKGIPLWCFHGASDDEVNVKKSRDLIAALKTAGSEPRYTEYPGVGHDSWTQTFASEETFQWLFEQKRQ